MSSKTNTCVFWDVEDYPIPDGHDPGTIYENIKSALANKGYRGNVEIWVYGEKNKIWDEFLIVGIPVIPEGDKCARVYRMMSDVLLWALDNPSDYPVLLPNVMVISKSISQEEGFLRVLRILQCRGYNILLADSDYDVIDISSSCSDKLCTGFKCSAPSNAFFKKMLLNFPKQTKSTSSSSSYFSLYFVHRFIYDEE